MAYFKRFIVLSSFAAVCVAPSAYALSLSVLDNGVDVGGQASVTENGADSMNTHTNVVASGNSHASVNAVLSIPLVITRATVSTLGSGQNASSSVQSRDGLSAYISSQMKADADLTAVDTAPDHVAVTHREHALLFGVIPVEVDTTATTDPSGNVSVSYPWWSFPPASDQAQLRSDIRSSVDAALGVHADASAEGNTQLSVQQQVALIAAMRSMMAAHLSSSAQASANVQ